MQTFFHIKSNQLLRTILFQITILTLIVVKNVETIRENFWTCLRNTILTWWINELIDNEKRMTKFIVNINDKLNEWTRLLKIKFKKSFNVTLKIITKKKYIFCNVFSRRESREYVQKILRLIKNIEFNNLQNQLNIIYNDIDSSLRKNDIKRFKFDVILNKFLKNLNNCKHNWWNYDIKILYIQKLKNSSIVNNQRFDKNN